MNKKYKIIIAAIAAGLLVAAVSAYFIFKGYIFEVIIEKSQIQESIDSKLPFQKTYFLIFQASVDSAKVVLADGSDRIGIDSAIKLNVTLANLKEPLECGFVGTGKIRYEKSDYSFYLDDLALQEINVHGVPAKYQEKVRAISELLLKDHFAKRPVCKLSQDATKIQLAKAVLRDVKIINGKLYVYLGYE